MSNTYQHMGVTIDAQGGGVYELSHPSLEQGERVRGKERAEARAEEIAAAADDPDAPLEQPDLAAAAAALAGAAPETPQVATVQVTEGEVPPSRVPASVPRRYEGTLSEAQKAAIGVKFVRIVLEENDDIPPTGLFLGHNGRGYMITPGEEVDVPVFLTEVLDHAVMSAPVVDSKTKKVLGYRNRSKYPYRRV